MHFSVQCNVVHFMQYKILHTLIHWTIRIVLGLSFLGLSIKYGRDLYVTRQIT
jgi:hypothetical protein